MTFIIPNRNSIVAVPISRTVLRYAGVRTHTRRGDRENGNFINRGNSSISKKEQDYRAQYLLRWYYGMLIIALLFGD